jgi:hypothetical protein
MKFDTQTAATYAAQKLDSLIERSARDTAEILQSADIPTTVVYFDQLRETVRDLAAKVAVLQKHCDQISQEYIPTMFTNANVKTIKVDDVGRVTVNIRWTASMVDKEVGLGWLRQTNNEGLIIETVNAQTLGSFAKEEVIAGRPLPEEIFKVSATPYTSITKN